MVRGRPEQMEKLTVKEYADLKGTSVQAVYKRIDKLTTIKEEKNGKEITFILVGENGADDFNHPQPSSTDDFNHPQPSSTPNDEGAKPSSTDNLNHSQPSLTEDVKPSSTTAPQGVDAVIDALREQLRQKDKQIETLQQQNKEQFDRLTELLLRSQQLEAITQRLLLEQPPEDNTTEEQPPEPENIKEEQPKVEPIETEKEVPPEKKGFFRRLFGI